MRNFFQNVISANFCAITALSGIILWFAGIDVSINTGSGCVMRYTPEFEKFRYP